MTEQASPRPAGHGDHAGVVHPLARAAQRSCARPGCRAAASATLGFRYESREAWLTPLADRDMPATYDLCADHARRTRPPHGWSLEDERPALPDADSTGSGQRPDTVTVLADALRALPGESAAQW